MFYLNSIRKSKSKTGRKCVALLIMVAFLFQLNVTGYAQSEDDIVRQFHRARDGFANGQYMKTRQRIERIVGIIGVNRVDRKDILGMCYLLLGAIYEKESKPILAEENYLKARDTYGITLVDGVDLETLEIYRKILKGEGQPDPSQGTIEKEGKKKKKKKFPWLLVAGTAVVVGVVLFMVLKKKKRYTLTVNMGDGVEGTPGNGTHRYTKGERVGFNYKAVAGYGNLTVLLDGNPADVSGTVVMTGNHTLTVNTNTLSIATDKDVVNVPEGGTAGFDVWLSGKPDSEVRVGVSRISGDTDLNLQSSSLLTFTPDNWNIKQTVTLEAAVDTGDIVNGEATFRLNAGGDVIPVVDIKAIEVDADNIRFDTDRDSLTIEEGGGGFFQLRLTARPPNGDVVVNISKVDGSDDSIIIRNGSRTKTFTAIDWDKYQPVNLHAGADVDSANGEATIRISTASADIPEKLVSVFESDTDNPRFIVDPVPSNNIYTVPEGGQTEVRVKLSAQPAGTVSVDARRISGDTDITVSSGKSLTFNPSNWNIFQTITVSAANDNDAGAGKAVIEISANEVENKQLNFEEGEKDSLGFQTDKDQVTVDEGGEATFQVKLTAQPPSSVEVNIGRFSGDKNITVSSGGTLTFGTADWDDYKTVTLVAANDEDDENGTATIRISSNQVETKDIAAVENDTGTGDPPVVSIKSPADGVEVSEEVSITTVAGDDFNVKMVELFVDDVKIDSTTDVVHTFKWNTRDYEAGAYQIKARVYDDIDQTDESVITVNLIDNKPIVTSFTIDPHTDPLTGLVVISIDAYDYRGLSLIDFHLDGVSLTRKGIESQQNGNYTFDLQTRHWSNGPHTYTAIVYDNAGQASDPVVLDVNVENQN
ncbi:MAG: hypothetical protein GY940_01950 [bacterium]|nr:hypothetical protein [bacterium]